MDPFVTRCFGICLVTGAADSSSRFSLPYSKRKAWAVGETPCARATSTAADHSRAGIGKRPVCALRHRSKRRLTFCMSWEISGDCLAIVGPPSLRMSERPTLATTARSSHAGSPKAHERALLEYAVHRMERTGGLPDREWLTGNPSVIP